MIGSASSSEVQSAPSPAQGLSSATGSGYKRQGDMKSILAFNDYFNEELAKRSSLAGNGEKPRENLSGAAAAVSGTALFENLQPLDEDPPELRSIIFSQSQPRLEDYFRKKFDESRSAAASGAKLFSGVGRSCKDG